MTTNNTKSNLCKIKTKINVKDIKLKERKRRNLKEYLRTQHVTNRANTKTCKKKTIITKTRSLDGRREAMKTEATIDAFKEMLLVRIGVSEVPGA